MRKSRYAPFFRLVVLAGCLLTLVIPLTPGRAYARQQTGKVKITSNVDDAVFTLAGVTFRTEAGKALTIGNIPPGRYTVMARKAGHRTWRGHLEVRPDAISRLHIRMIARGGSSVGKAKDDRPDDRVEADTQPKPGSAESGEATDKKPPAPKQPYVAYVSEQFSYRTEIPGHWTGRRNMRGGVPRETFSAPPGSPDKDVSITFWATDKSPGQDLFTQAHDLRKRWARFSGFQLLGGRLSRLWGREATMLGVVYLPPRATQKFRRLQLIVEGKNVFYLIAFITPESLYESKLKVFARFMAMFKFLPPKADRGS